MRPIAVVCLMLLWPVLGWGEEPHGTSPTQKPRSSIPNSAAEGYQPGSRVCFWHNGYELVIPEDLAPSDIEKFREDCEKRELLVNREMEQELKGLQRGGAPPQSNLETLAIETAKMVGFEYVVSSRPKPNHPYIMYMDSLEDAPLTARCLPDPNENKSASYPFPCQVYAGQTGKILNLECRNDLQQCMVTGVLDIHQ